MKYCGPWKEEKPDYWTLRDTEGRVLASASNRGYPIPFGSIIHWWIDGYVSAEKAKAEVEERVRSIGDWMIFKDERLLVMM